MILGMEIALIVVGLLALVRGRMKLDGSHVVYGLPARFLGLVALTPIPLSALAVIVYASAHITPGDPAAADRFVDDNRWTLLLIEAGCTIGVAVFVFGFGRLFCESECAEPTVRSIRPVDDTDEAVKRWLQNRAKRTEDEAVPLVAVNR